MLYNQIQYVSTKTPSSFDYAVLNSQLYYGNFLWGQNINTIKCLFFRKKHLEV